MNYEPDDYPAVVASDRVAGLKIISGSQQSSQGALAVLRHEGRTVDVRRLAGGWRPEDLWVGEEPCHFRSLDPTEDDLAVTVAVCTLGVHPRLHETVRSALEQTYEGTRVVIVDNDPDSGATRRALGDLARLVTIVDERRRGLSYARNTAIDQVLSGIIAFTDDDAILEPSWVEMLVKPFKVHASVAAVTGLVVPAELRTPAQRAFEAYVGFGKGLQHCYWALDSELKGKLPGSPGPTGVLYPLTAGKVGSGNNMAFRVEVLRALGGFDVSLGAGSVAQGGEDLDMFTRILLNSKAILYTPDAMVWHYHRETVPELIHQIRANGVGMGALITKSIMREPSVIVQVVWRSLAVAKRAFSTRGRTGDQRAADLSPDLRRRLLKAEVRGLLSGPRKYLGSRAERQ